MAPALVRVLRAAADIALSLDAQGRVVHALARDAGLHERVQAWRGRALVDLVTTEARPKLDTLLQGLAKGEEATAARHLNHTLEDGSELPVLYSATAYPSAGLGDDPPWLLTGRDLRDAVGLHRRLIEAQQALERDHWKFREAETRYRGLFQGSGEAMLLVDATQLRVLDANPAAQQLLEGIRGRKARLVGAGLSAQFAPEAAEALSAAAAAARSLGHAERRRLLLADGQSAVQVSIAPFQQDGTAQLLVRLQADATGETGSGRGTRLPATGTGPSDESRAAAYVAAANDALVFTDTTGRVLGCNRAFAQLAQLAGERVAEGEPLDRWLGRPGVELPVLLANLREGGNPGLLATEVRGTLGMVTAVEVAATRLDATDGPACAFALRDVERRLAPGEEALPRVPASVKQLSELVGRVPLKQIVAETSDLIERLSIEAALQMTRDNRALAAQMLGLSRQSLYVKLRRFGMGGLGGEEPEDGPAP